MSRWTLRIFCLFSLGYFAIAAYHDLYLNRFFECGAPNDPLPQTANPAEIWAELKAIAPQAELSQEFHPQDFPALYRALYPLPSTYIEVRGADLGLVRKVGGMLQARQSTAVRCLSRGFEIRPGTPADYLSISGLKLSEPGEKLAQNSK